jgi:hypothetical protein
MGRSCGTYNNDGRVYTFLQNLNERDNLGDLGIHGRIIVKWVLTKRNTRVWIGFNWIRIGKSGGLF